MSLRSSCRSPSCAAASVVLVIGVHGQTPARKGFRSPLCESVMMTIACGATLIPFDPGVSMSLTASDA
jgi:hypothetical protein